jgi:hypothetical protein
LPGWSEKGNKTVEFENTSKFGFDIEIAPTTLPPPKKKDHPSLIKQTRWHGEQWDIKNNEKTVEYSKHWIVTGWHYCYAKCDAKVI